VRVLHVYKSYFPDSQGGLEEAIHQICRTTLAYGAENRVFTLSPEAHPAVVSREEAEVYRFSRTAQIASCDLSLGAWRGFRELTNWADVVHFHFPWPMGDLLHLVTRPRIPAVVTYHSDIVRQRRLGALYRPLMRRFLGSARSIVATSPNYFASSDVLSRFSEKVEVIPIGLDEESYPDPDEARMRTMREKAGEGFFLFVGVLRYYKGLHILLDAIRGTGLPVVIVGSGPVEAELKERAEVLDLKNVRFLGRVSNEEKVALIRLARAVVFPSYLRSEAFGVTLVEGAMQGRPLISTEIGTGTSYVNVDEETGFVVPPADPRRLREAMQRLAFDPGLAETLGQGARRRFEQYFTGEVMGEKYVALYCRLGP